MEKGESLYTVGGNVNLVYPPQKTACRFPKKLKIELPCDSATPLLSIYPEKTKHYSEKIHAPNVHSSRICNSWHTEAIQVLTNRPLAWGNVGCVCVCVCVVEYHSVIKKNEILPFVPTQVDLETIIPSEINRERQVLHDIIHIWNVKVIQDWIYIY